jgi:tRNA(fMet)-specific endonuclease VapC
VFLLDTDTCIEILRGRSKRAAERLREAGPDRVGIPAVVRAELEFGARTSQRPAENLRLVKAFCAPLARIAFDEDAALAYGELRAALQAQGLPIGPHDLLIAAGALAAGATLVTANVREFGRVPDLSFENWTG